MLVILYGTRKDYFALLISLVMLNKTSKKQGMQFQLVNNKLTCLDKENVWHAFHKILEEFFIVIVNINK